MHLLFQFLPLMKTLAEVASYFVLLFPHCQSPFQIEFFLGKYKKKSRAVQGRDKTEAAAFVEFRVWLRNVAQLRRVSWCVAAEDLSNP